MGRSIDAHRSPAAQIIKTNARSHSNVIQTTDTLFHIIFQLMEFIILLTYLNENRDDFNRILCSNSPTVLVG